MASLYSNDLRGFIKSRPWPVRVRWDVVEFETCLKIRLYRDNINSLSGDEKLALATVLNETLENIRQRGVPIYTWVVKGDGKDVQVGDYLPVD